MQQTAVFVLSSSKEPLMPTKAAKARKLLKAKRARVVRLHPFTIQLRFEPATSDTQPIVLGIDTGSKHVGIAAVGNGKVLYMAEAEIERGIPEKMKTRASLRRGRRNRLRHRPARWAHRANSKREGRLVPTSVSKLEAHKRLISFVADKLLPISRIVLELASFDTQQMQNPEISGVEYQRGELMGFQIWEYLLTKWERKCAYCGVENVPFEKEHIIPKARGGTNRVSNLTLACHSCNQAKGTRTAAEFGFPEIQKRAKLPLKDAAHVTVFKNHLKEWCGKRFGWHNTVETHGYVTKFKRKALGWGKSHANDAAAISLKVGEFAIKPVAANGNDVHYLIWFRRRATRQLHNSVPTKCHNFTKKQLREKALARGGIAAGLKGGWLRALSEAEAKATLPTKVEAAAFVKACPGYRIVRTRKTYTLGGVWRNEKQERPPTDTTGGKMGKWRKGHVISYKGKTGIVSGLDAKGQFRYKFFDGTADRTSVKKVKLLMRASGINHWPIVVAPQHPLTLPQTDFTRNRLVSAVASQNQMYAGSR